MWRNTPGSYGHVSIALHWLIATTTFGLFALGLWMVELDYYDGWYQRAPDIHKSTGMLLFAAALLRVLWRYSNPRPAPLGTTLEKHTAVLVHSGLDILLFIVMISGYLISTADNRAIEVFSLFSVPATIAGLDNQADIAGAVHTWLAYALTGLAAVHAMAALKHHYIDRDNTLRRMLGSRM